MIWFFWLDADHSRGLIVVIAIDYVEKLDFFPFTYIAYYLIALELSSNLMTNPE